MSEAEMLVCGNKNIISYDLPKVEAEFLRRLQLIPDILAQTQDAIKEILQHLKVL